MTSSKLVTQDGKPKADVVFYEDFLCPACGNFERAFGPTVSKLIDSGAIAADYYMMGLLSRPQNEDYSSRAGNAAYCVADESIDAFRRFHNDAVQQEHSTLRDRHHVPRQRQIDRVSPGWPAWWARFRTASIAASTSRWSTDWPAAAGIHATPTVRINGQDYQWSTPQALVDKIKEIVGDVPGLDTAANPAAS